MIGNRPRPWKVPTTPPVGDRKERIIGQNAGHEIPLEIEDVLDKKRRKKGGHSVILKSHSFI